MREKWFLCFAIIAFRRQLAHFRVHRSIMTKQPAISFAVNSSTASLDDEAEN
jgi:hypothetical protein